MIEENQSLSKFLIKLFFRRFNKENEKFLVSLASIIERK